jgi:hypothetical protein
MMRHLLKATLAFVLVAALPSAGIAQNERNSLVAINPFGIPFDIIQVEYERRTGGAASVGGIASYTDIDDDRRTTFDMKVRYYPAADVFNRLSAGLSLGYTRFSTLHFDCSFSSCFESRRALSAPTVGVLLDYNWVQGRERRFVVGIGAGAKRILASEEARERVDIGRAQFTGRFVVGLKF